VAVGRLLSRLPADAGELDRRDGWA
jgi:hypothetical protein